MRDVLCGGASVSLAAAKEGIAKRYWLNDLFYPVFNFWHIVSRLGQELVNEVFFIHELTDEKLRERVLEGKERLLANKPYDSLLMATDFFILNRCSFSGSTLCGGLKGKIRERFNLSNITRILDCYVVMKDFGFTGVDFSTVIQKGGTESFLFCDPPYISASKLYGNGGDLHDDFDHIKLAELLHETDHKFMLTYDDHYLIRRWYGGFNIRELGVTNSMDNCGKSGKPKRVKELVITNY